MSLNSVSRVKKWPHSNIKIFCFNMIECSSMAIISAPLYFLTLISRIITIISHHYNCSILILISSSIFLYLSTFSSLFSKNISTSSSASVPYHLLISCSSPHSMTKCLTGFSPAHNRHPLLHLHNPASIWVSGYWFYIDLIETTRPNHIHCCIYPHPPCSSYSYKAPALFYSLYSFSVCYFLSCLLPFQCHLHPSSQHLKSPVPIPLNILWAIYPYLWSCFNS